LDFENNTVKLPWVGETKAVLHKTFKGELKTAEILMSFIGKYSINIYSGRCNISSS
jgi:putative transposase